MDIKVKSDSIDLTNELQKHFDRLCSTTSFGETLPEDLDKE